MSGNDSCCSGQSQDVKSLSSNKSASLTPLSYYTFYPFMRTTDVSLVLFYEGKSEMTAGDRLWYMTQLLKTAKMSKRCNTAYVTVDCSEERMLCMQEQVPRDQPVARLYSGVNVLVEFKNKSDVSPTILKKLIEAAPSPEPECC